MEALAVSLAFFMTLEARLEAQLKAFPPREVVAAQIEFASFRDNYLWFMTEILPCDSEFSDQWKYHCLACWPWVCLQIAQDKTESLSFRIYILKKLKEKLDTDTHLRGQMPPIACYWRFCEGPPPLGTRPAPARNKTGMGIVSKPEPQ